LVREMNETVQKIWMICDDRVKGVDSCLGVASRVDSCVDSSVVTRKVGGLLWKIPISGRLPLTFCLSRYDGLAEKGEQRHLGKVKTSVRKNKRRTGTL
jgi:hypothetical protein